MTVPGVGPVVALTYRATVDVPARFRNSKAVGAVFGLTPSRYQSGESDRSGRISRCGDEMTRMMLYEAAQSMLAHSAKWSWLKAWAMKIARHRGMKKAIVALARRLAVIPPTGGSHGKLYRTNSALTTARESDSILLVSEITPQFPTDIEALHALLAAARAERDAAIAERDQALSQIDRLRYLLRQLQRA